MGGHNSAEGGPLATYLRGATSEHSEKSLRNDSESGFK